MIFAPGDEVVCVDDDPHNEAPRNRGASGSLDGLKAGTHYIVRWCGTWIDGEPCVRVAGIVRGARDWPYHISRFRPVKRESIEIFHQMCVSKKPLIPVEG